MNDTESPAWRKASYSGNSMNCVEAASAPGAVLVRDSKDREAAVLAFPAGAWRRFTAERKGGAR